MFRTLKTTLTALTVSAALLVPALAAAGPAGDAVKARRTEMVAKLKEGAGADRDKKVAAIVAQMFDFDAMARSSLGKHWDDLSDAQKAEFSDLLKQLVQRSLEKNVRETMKYDVDWTSEEAGDNGTLVKSKAKKSAKDDPIAIDYLLHDAGGWRVIDIVTEGSSMVGTYRSQFRRILEKDGYDALIKKMKAKLKKG